MKKKVMMIFTISSIIPLEGHAPQEQASQAMQNNNVQREEAIVMAGKIVTIFGSVMQAICECKAYDAESGDPRKPFGALMGIVNSFADCIATGTRSMPTEANLRLLMIDYLCGEEGVLLMEQYRTITKATNL